MTKPVLGSKLVLRIAALSLLAVQLMACSQESAPTDGLSVGKPFPDIPLTSLDGQKSSLADYRGKLIVLNLWATWCEPCRREMPHLQELSDALGDEQFAVIGVAGEDDPHIVREYLRDKKIEFAEYIDVGQQTASERLGVKLYPYTFVIAPDGTFLQRYPGPREWHRQEVIELLKGVYQGDYSGL